MTAILTTLTALLAAHPLLAAIVYMVLGAVLLIQHACTREGRLAREAHLAWVAELEAGAKRQIEALGKAPTKVWSFTA